MCGQPSDALDTYYYVLLLALDVLDGCYLAHLVVIFHLFTILAGFMVDLWSSSYPIRGGYDQPASS